MPSALKRQKDGGIWHLGGLAVLMLCCAGLAVWCGAMPISPAQLGGLLQALWSGTPTEQLEGAVLVGIRLPRVLLSLMVGAVLGTCGAAMQGLFRNPLADPGLVGISSGAALGAGIMIVLGAGLPHDTWWAAGSVPAAAFLGALVTTLVVYLVSQRSGAHQIADMLLCGIAINALAMAGLGTLTLLANDQELRDLTFWSLGSMGGATWDRLRLGLPTMGLALVALPWLGRSLNAWLLGEEEAAHLGVSARPLTLLVVVCCALSVGAAVSICGVVGFIGLVVPHMVRLWAGPDHRFLLPASALVGGAVLCLADVLARTLWAPVDLPIGIVTAYLGAPFFLWLMHRMRRTRHYA